MSRVCELSGKRKQVGYNVSHSNRHTKRTFAANVTKRTIIDPFTGTKLKIKVSTRAMRTLVKNPARFKAALNSLVKKQIKRATKA
ncbi:50S ribosomal protein L28 [Candidatus Peregrinibacteria bacterium]|nr:50S ribosomal protein L28 [Candidatus Peregrinibacteria bacterium]